MNAAAERAPVRAVYRGLIIEARGRQPGATYHVLARADERELAGPFLGAAGAADWIDARLGHAPPAD
jgi:hypothetical protein